MKLYTMLAVVLLSVTGCSKNVETTETANTRSKIEPNGTVELNAVKVPISSLLSPEAHEFMRRLIVDKPFGAPVPDIKNERARQDEIMGDFLRPMRLRYDVAIEEKEIGGVFTQIVTPSAGIGVENLERVLINVHGGGFVTGGRSASLVESVPLAALMGIKVISIDYRMGPEYQFPAASIDVAAVYREVIKTYKPENIGLYGCSAGGLLAAQAIAWFDRDELPQPGGVGVFCAPLGQFFVGDTPAISGPLNGRIPPVRKTENGDDPVPTRRVGYLDEARSNDPLAYPLSSGDVLKKFPPTLFITATRAFEFSAVLNSNNVLAKTGVKTKLHAWDGLNHAFFYNSEMPESRDAYDVMVNFFDENLGK
ncbi:MAG: alpha/beta hydrolase [Alphaproteobacteria bacterium]|nr:MAG: alpha/beta hydrolase [Alphaproteobacteria bacterium]